VVKTYGNFGGGTPSANFPVELAEPSAGNVAIFWQKSAFRHTNCQFRQLVCQKARPHAKLYGIV
jgi:hypothetical protein